MILMSGDVGILFLTAPDVFCYRTCYTGHAPDSIQRATANTKTDAKQLHVIIIHNGKQFPTEFFQNHA